MQEQTHTIQPPTVPRSIVRSSKHTNNDINGTIQQWPASPAKRQQTMATTQAEERTVMSNLSPDDSAKTMMTNVSRMVET
jgi:TFIIF-interacting CTD phosphatase-like protein